MLYPSWPELVSKCSIQTNSKAKPSVLDRWLRLTWLRLLVQNIAKKRRAIPNDRRRLRPASSGAAAHPSNRWELNNESAGFPVGR